MTPHRSFVRTCTAALVLTGTFAGLPASQPLRAAPAPATAVQDDSRSDEFRWQGAIQAGQDVEVRGINGPIHVEPSSGNQVEVHAIKTGRRDDPNSVRIVVVPHAQGVTICSLYPDVDGEPNECRPGGGGRNNNRDNDVKVEFHVRVPAAAAFAGRTVNGSVDVKDLGGRATIETVNGSVDLSTSSYANVKTVNGAINAQIGRADWTDTLTLKTVNGSIDLHLPGPIDADLTARTVNGRISSDLPISVHEVSRRSLRGTLGSGGRGLSLETVNGSINLKTGG